MVLISSKPSLVTFSPYRPAARSCTENFPDSSELRTIGLGAPPPLISIRAPATNAPEGSFTVPWIVSARSPVANTSANAVKNIAVKNCRESRRPFLQIHTSGDVELACCARSDWVVRMSSPLELASYFPSERLSLSAPASLGGLPLHECRHGISAATNRELN